MSTCYAFGKKSTINEFIGLIFIQSMIKIKILYILIVTKVWVIFFLIPTIMIVAINQDKSFDFDHIWGTIFGLD